MVLLEGDWIPGVLYSSVDYSIDDSIAECITGSGALLEVAHWGCDPERWNLLPGTSLLSLPPGHHEVSSFPLPDLSTMLFLPWSQPTMKSLATMTINLLATMNSNNHLLFWVLGVRYFVPRTMLLRAVQICWDSHNRDAECGPYMVEFTISKFWDKDKGQGGSKVMSESVFHIHLPGLERVIFPLSSLYVNTPLTKFPFSIKLLVIPN